RRWRLRQRHHWHRAGPDGDPANPAAGMDGGCPSLHWHLRELVRVRDVAPPLLVTFAAGLSEVWRIDRIEAVIGSGLPPAEGLAVLEDGGHPGLATWVLRGVTSNTRYTQRQELDTLAARQEALGRPHATRAALIPIRKTDAWWALAQDE